MDRVQSAQDCVVPTVGRPPRRSGDGTSTESQSVMPADSTTSYMGYIYINDQLNFFRLFCCFYVHKTEKQTPYLHRNDWLHELNWCFNQIFCSWMYVRALVFCCGTFSSRHEILQLAERTSVSVVNISEVGSYVQALNGTCSDLAYDIAYEACCLPSVLWHCWLGSLTRKTRPRYDL